MKRGLASVGPFFFALVIVGTTHETMKVYLTSTIMPRIFPIMVSWVHETN